MRARWADLITWQGCIACASSLYENDGYPKRSPAPTPQADACLSPCPVCVDSGWCVEMGGRPSCTAPEHHVPIEYATEAATACPARRYNAIVGLDPQTSRESHGHPFPDDETLSVLRWTKNTLIAVAVSDIAPSVRKYAEELASGKVEPTLMVDCEALGKEIHRRYCARYDR